MPPKRRCSVSIRPLLTVTRPLQKSRQNVELFEVATPAKIEMEVMPCAVTGYTGDPIPIGMLILRLPVSALHTLSNWYVLRRAC